MEVLVVGELNADIVVRPVERVDYGLDHQQVEQLNLRSGGDAMNNAVGLSRLGNQVTLVGRIGRDPFGDFLLEEARRAGIEVGHMAYSDGTLTNRVMALINGAGARTFYHAPGTSKEFCPKDIEPGLLDRCGHLHIGGTFHLPRFDGAGAVALLKAAKERGLTTSTDATWDPTGRWGEILEAYYPYLDYFLPSLGEARVLTGLEEPKEMAAYFRYKGVAVSGIKLGSRGCYVHGERRFYLGAYDVPVVDTTGAGDSFYAGFLTGMFRGLTLEQCAVWATAAANLSIQQVGANTGSPRLEELTGFINNSESLEIRYVQE